VKKREKELVGAGPKKESRKRRKKTFRDLWGGGWVPPPPPNPGEIKVPHKRTNDERKISKNNGGGKL